MIPMNPICPRCGGKHGVEVSGDGYEHDCAACHGHLMCAIGLEGEMYPYHREDGSCGCNQEPHTCDLDEDDRAQLLTDQTDSPDPALAETDAEAVGQSTKGPPP